MKYKDFLKPTLTKNILTTVFILVGFYTVLRPVFCECTPNKLIIYSSWLFAAPIHFIENAQHYSEVYGGFWDYTLLIFMFKQQSAKGRLPDLTHWRSPAETDRTRHKNNTLQTNSDGLPSKAEKSQGD